MSEEEETAVNKIRKTMLVSATAIFALGTVLSLAALTAISQAVPLPQQSRDTRIGRIELERGFPPKVAVTKLYDELDFQRA